MDELRWNWKHKHWSNLLCFILESLNLILHPIKINKNCLAPRIRVVIHLYKFNLISCMHTNISANADNLRNRAHSCRWRAAKNLNNFLTKKLHNAFLSIVYSRCTWLEKSASRWNQAIKKHKRYGQKNVINYMEEKKQEFFSINPFFLLLASSAPHIQSPFRSIAHCSTNHFFHSKSATKSPNENALSSLDTQNTRSHIQTHTDRQTDTYMHSTCTTESFTRTQNE